MNNQPIKTIFRKYYEDGRIIALFPEVLPEGCMWYHCGSYINPRGYGATDPKFVINRTVTATKAELQELKAELEELGYVLDVRHQYTAEMYDARVLASGLIRDQLSYEHRMRLGNDRPTE